LLDSTNLDHSELKLNNLPKYCQKLDIQNSNILSRILIC